MQATCTWYNYTTLSVTLDSSATIVPKTDNVTLLANKVGHYNLDHVSTSLALAGFYLTGISHFAISTPFPQIKAYCTSTTAKCAAWPYASSQYVSVGYPSTALYPSPTLAYTSTISSCDALAIDASSSTVRPCSTPH